jgi:hypothetical protein
MYNTHYKAARGLSLGSQQLRQFSGIGGNAPRLILAEQLGR